MTNEKFKSDINRWITKSNKALSQYARKVTIEMYSSVVLKSPVDTGRFRANWMVGNGRIDETINLNEDKTGGVTILKAASEINSIKINGQTIFVSNSLPYAQKIEYGLYGTGAGATEKTTRDGYSIQAPYGMVRITLAEFNSILNKAAYEVKTA